MFEVEPAEEGGGTVASYFVHWTLGKSFADHPANFDLIYGAWGSGTSKNDRCAISLIYFETEGVPGVSLINATDRPVASYDLVGSALSRDELIDTSLAQQVFAIFDAVILQDGRLS